MNSRSNVIPMDSTNFVPSSEEADGEYVPGELLVAFRPGIAASRAQVTRKALGAVTIEEFSEIGVQHWRLPAGLSVGKAIRELSANPNVLYAEPNYIRYANVIPNDTHRNDLWGLHNIGQTGGTMDADIDALEAWAVQTGSSTIVVGVIDSGIDYNHEDLSANIWVNPGEIPDNGIDDDANGYVDDVSGWDFANDDNDPMDDNGHGTHTSGTVGAMGNNGVGVVGVNWNVQIMPLKFLGANGGGSISNEITAINYAASFEDESGNKIVRITSNSYGGSHKSKTEQTAIANSGALFVAAAGNSGKSKPKAYPAGYNLDNIISVAATDHNDDLASFSNYGSNWVDLAAPGVDTLSTYPDDRYRTMSGTSMSTPHVAGVAVLVLAQNPGWTIAQVKDRILATVDPLPSLQGKTLTGGRLNARLAVGAPNFPDDSTSPAAVTDLAVVSVSVTSANLIWTAPGDDGNAGTAYLYDVRYLRDDAITEVSWDAATRAQEEPIPVPAGSSQTFTVKRLTPTTTYYFALKTMDEMGNPSGLSNSASGTTESTGWTVEVVSTHSAGYTSLAFDPFGNPALAYDWYDEAAETRQLEFAHYNGVSWDIEVVATGDDVGSPGISLAYDPSGAPSIVHGWGKLYFVAKSGSSWVTTEIESENVYFRKGLAFDPAGTAYISYVTRVKEGRGKNAVTFWALKLASRTGTTWSTEVVDPGAQAVYNALALDPNGNPAIAYTDDLDADVYGRDSLKFARWTGSVWDIQVVESGVWGYGYFVSLAYDPVTGHPSISHRPCAVPVRFLRWTGHAWVREPVDDSTMDTGGCTATSLTYGSDGTANLAWAAGRAGPEDPGMNLNFAQRDPILGTWSVEIADFDGVGHEISVKVGPVGIPAIGYTGYSDDTTRFARKEVP
ncbi:MAG: S8 family serine peptidase [Thermoplasmata archaeon]